MKWATTLKKLAGKQQNSGGGFIEVVGNRKNWKTFSRSPELNKILVHAKKKIWIGNIGMLRQPSGS